MGTILTKKKSLPSRYFLFHNFDQSWRGTVYYIVFLRTWGVQVLRYPNFFSGMEADRNVKVVGEDVAVL